MVKGFWDLSYENRLERLNLPTLESRRVRGDLIQIYKLIMGFETISSSLNNMLYRSAPRSRFRIRRDIVKDFNPRHNFLFAEANSVNMFKEKLDKWTKIKNLVLLYE